MKATSPAKATYEDLLKVPENLIAELIDGDLYAWQRPAGTHLDTSSVLGMIIGLPYRIGDGGPGGWWILDKPELHLGDNVLVPALAGWRRERMPELPSDHRFIIEPDWVCEVISTASARVVRGRKLRIYAKCGVLWLWLVDPDYRILEPYKLRTDSGHRAVHLRAMTSFAPNLFRPPRSISLRSGVRRRKSLALIFAQRTRAYN
jgi:Uma2 family endonuclease